MPSTVEIMTKGHIAVAEELGIDLPPFEALEISADDAIYSTCIVDDFGGYVVYKTSRSITGTVHILTKLYVPKEHRGKGYARKLLDRCETPLITSDDIKVVRDERTNYTKEHN
jgi:GNAT superfamily N-acetyltransferase